MYQRILVPVDGSPTSNAGLAEAIKLAKLTAARMRLLHFINEMPYMMSTEGYSSVAVDMLASLKEAGTGILEQARIRVEAQGIVVDTVLLDTFGARLCELVVEQVAEWGADVIVLGTHGRRGVRRVLLGSDAEQIVRTATVPVLLIRGKEAELMPENEAILRSASNPPALARL